MVNLGKIPKYLDFMPSFYIFYDWDEIEIRNNKYGKMISYINPIESRVIDSFIKNRRFSQIWPSCPPKSSFTKKLYAALME